MPNDKVYVQPSEAAQHLANHLFNEFGVVLQGIFHEQQAMECNDVHDLSRAIQEYWDSLP